mgnify:CR=1 FL=1
MGHEVDDHVVPEAVTEPGLLEDVRRVRHRLHAAGHDHAVVPGADHLVGHLDGANARGADFVDRVGRRLLWEPGADCGLACWGLPRSTLKDLAHDHVLDLVVGDVDAVESSADRDRAELGGLAVPQRSAQLSEGRPDGRDDDRARHEVSLATD